MGRYYEDFAVGDTYQHWPGRPAPKLGQHTKEILRELGFDDREVEELRRAGAI